LGIQVRKMSALNVEIDNRVEGSGATLQKLRAYVIYGFGLALSYIYNAYLCIPISIKLFLSSSYGCREHTVSELR